MAKKKGYDGDLVLHRAVELINQGWTKHAEARNAKGFEVDFKSPEACSFCVQGAIKRAGWELFPKAFEARAYSCGAFDAQRRVQQRADDVAYGTVSFNDFYATSPAEVVNLLESCLTGVFKARDEEEPDDDDVH